MNLQDWKIIDMLYQFKNITKAAEQLFISQPALTARIKQIEADLEITLLIRHRRGVQFTSEGEYLAQSAKEMLIKYKQIRETLDNMKDTVAGTLKLGASKYLAKYKLPKLLRLFQDEYPLVEFKVFSDWSGDIYKLISNRDIHVGFIRGDYPWKTERQLLFYESVCVAYSEPFEWSDLPSLPRILYGTDYRFKGTVDEWWFENFNSPPNISIEVDQVDTCKEMIANKLGYGILPHLTIDDVPHLYKKTIKDKNGDPIIRDSWMYYHEDTLNINKINAFISFVKTIDIKSL